MSHRLTVFALALGMPFLGACVALAAWTDVTPASVSDTTATIGVAFVDIDLDGDPDLHFLTEDTGYGYDPRDRVYRNDSGEYARVAPELESPLTDQAAAWGDADGDGDLDVFVAGLPSRFYRNDAGTFVDATVPPLDIPGKGAAASWADFDLDGDLDLAASWIAPGPGIRFLENVGGGTFADVTPAFLVAYPFGGIQSIAWGDFDNDGDPDPYFVRNLTAFGPGPNQLLRNDLGAGFTDVTVPPLDDGGFGHGGVWGDVDNDGDLDLYVTNLFGANRMILNENGSFLDASWGPLGDTGNVAGVAFGDYDNDGWLDLYYAVALGPNRLLRNESYEGELTFTDVSEDPIWDLGVGAVWPSQTTTRMATSTS